MFVLEHCRDYVEIAKVTIDPDYVEIAKEGSNNKQETFEIATLVTLQGEDQPFILHLISSKKYSWWKSGAVPYSESSLRI
ncbi:hypothetical protein P8452_60803 [Trifolium repens]|nr:hypothetical protein P8452_60803 [Trifolium repens]